MASTGSVKQRLNQRLRPLYAAAFFQGFVLWYSIEKLFMRGIGFDDALIGVMVAIYSLVILLTETPSGILADRWSRKGVLMIASLCLALSGLVAGFSQSPTTFILATALWGVFYALYSGTYDSIIYDALYEDAGTAQDFEKYYGRVGVIDSTALVIGSLAGGALASWLEPRATYFISLPFILLSLIFLWRFREPQLHKSSVGEPIGQHIRRTFAAVLKNHDLLVVITVIILEGIATYIVLEFCQVWLLALDTPTTLFGPANAVLLSSLGLGSYLAGKLKFRRPARMAANVAVMLAAASTLVWSRHQLVTIVALAIFCTTLIIVSVVFYKFLHDALESRVRAGAASAASTLARVFIIPVALLFGLVSDRTNIFNAGWITFGFAALVSVFALIETGRQSAKPLV